MKSLVLPLAAVAALSLSGCAAYVGDPYYGGYGSPGYGSAAPAYGYGPSVSLGVYGYDGRGGRHWGDGDHRWRDRDGDRRGWR